MKQVFQHVLLGSTRNVFLPDVIVHDVLNNCNFLIENTFRCALGKKFSWLVCFGWSVKQKFLYFLNHISFSKPLPSDKKSYRKDSSFDSVKVRLRSLMHS